jgi:uncharacterized protein YecE (DUF72 family)
MRPRHHPCYATAIDATPSSPRSGRILVGCSGWNYGHWRERVYPAGLPPKGWLAHYARLFDTVEVNATFYRLPTRAAVAGWAATVPDDFVFAVKASRYLTHIRRLRDLEDGIALFYERLEPLVGSPKLGPMLWQLPARFPRDDDRLAAALSALPAGRHAFEFRHPSWFVPEVSALLAARDVALVIGDHPERPFQTLERTARWTFVRLHFGRARAKGRYGPGELDAWAARVAEWAAAGDVYVYFNNDWEAYAVRNARDLAQRLGVGPGRDAAPAVPPGTRRCAVGLRPPSRRRAAARRR